MNNRLTKINESLNKNFKTLRKKFPDKLPQNLLQHHEVEPPNIKKIIAITGEFYTSEGRLGFMIDEEKAYKYTSSTLIIGGIKL